jgi:hypothetical protein
MLAGSPLAPLAYLAIMVEETVMVRLTPLIMVDPLALAGDKHTRIL